MRTIAFFIVAALLVLSIAIAIARGPALKTGWQGDAVVNVDTDQVQNDTIRVMTWNISFAQGIGSDGSNYTPVSHDEMNARLRRMADLIVEERIDIVLLQEVDFSSGRSHSTDQLAFLAEKTKLKNRAYSTSWKVRYLPYPFLPFRHHWGKIVSGAGVLSRFPIGSSRSFFYEKPAEYSFLYAWFYPFRFRQETTLSIKNIPFRVLNNHLEAWAEGSRMRQAARLAEAVVDTLSASPILLFGGDLNSIPSALRSEPYYSAFPQHQVYQTDSTLKIVDSLPGFREVVPVDSIKANPEKWFSFPANAPTHRLDYLFVSESAKVVDYKVIRTGALSDHLPVVATILLSN
jgi:endonuclease/exonuclease/phosphatase family metal-dependent hydrolase